MIAIGSINKLKKFYQTETRLLRATKSSLINSKCCSLKMLTNLNQNKILIKMTKIRCKFNRLFLKKCYKQKVKMILTKAHSKE